MGAVCGCSKVSYLDTIQSTQGTACVIAPQHFFGQCVQPITGARLGGKQSSLTGQVTKLLLNAVIMEPSYGFSVRCWQSWLVRGLPWH